MSPSELQATLVDFALRELVRNHRTSFAPLWTPESWAKLLIWLALNCGCGTDPAS
ncbi:MAG: protein phosphatase, partial [Synechococcus sp. ELA057]